MNRTPRAPSAPARPVAGPRHSRAVVRALPPAAPGFAGRAPFLAPLLALLLAFALAAAFVRPAHAAEPLRERDVRAFVAAVADASRSRDVERIAATLADDCRILMRTRFGGKEHVTELDKAEYLAMLRDGFVALRDLERYDYQVGNVDVTLDGASGADVHAVVTETLVYGGRSSTTVSEEHSRIEKRDGRLVLVAVTATTSGPEQTAAR